MNNFFSELQRENNALLQSRSDLATTDNQKTVYQNNTISNYEFYNNVLYYVYYILVVFLFIYMTTKFKYSKFVFGVILVLLLTYPYFMDNVFVIIYNLLNYIGSVLMGYLYTPI